MESCFQWFKDTNLKANHNNSGAVGSASNVVSNGSKILIWKQITTLAVAYCPKCCCFQWFKDTNLKANHNGSGTIPVGFLVVSNGSKILIWKQITTYQFYDYADSRCFQWFKDTNLKANHNGSQSGIAGVRVVSNGSKILIWKQITTRRRTFEILYCCFQWFKDTNLKANHNFST